jgi:hypothetical protein
MASNVEKAAYSIDQFCAAFGLSRSMFYKLRAQGAESGDCGQVFRLIADTEFRSTLDSIPMIPDSGPVETLARRARSSCSLSGNRHMVENSSAISRRGLPRGRRLPGL